MKKDQVRVALDLSVLRHGLSNGSAVYSYRLAEGLLRLKPELDLTAVYCARRSGESVALLADLEAAGANVVHGPAPWRWSPDGAWWLPIAPPMGKVLESADIYHAGEFFLPYRASARCVVTIHDVTTVLFPETHMRLNRMLHRRRLRWIDRRADRVLASSASTRDDVLRLLPHLRDRIDCTPLALGTAPASPSEAGASAILDRLGLGGTRYVLTVGTLEPRKNHMRLVGAFAALPEHLGDVRLVIAGGRGWKSREIQKAIDDSPARERIHQLGFVPAPDLRLLYRAATIFAFPSLYEGFGLPILEAMAAGAPVLTSNLSSMPEIAGDAALTVDPHSVDAIRDGLERLLQDQTLRSRLIGRGYAREREFTWDATARATIQAYWTALTDAPVRESA
jgi:glycosyltransferase involved in cell wall biosynthesis